MNPSKDNSAEAERPILLIPYMWIGDFVRCHTVTQLLHARNPRRPVDVLTTTSCAPLVDYMPGVRKGIVCNLPRRQLPLRAHRELAARLRNEHYGQALVMPRTWKSALAPMLAGIPVRTGFIGELRFGLLNDIRWGEKKLPRMVDRCATLALPRDAPQPEDWPRPQLDVPLTDALAWRAQQGLPDDGRPIVAIAPGAVGPSKRWPIAHYAELASTLTREGAAVWVLGSPMEAPLASEIVGAAGAHAHDLTSSDLRRAILALRLASAAVSNDSGLQHVAAAIGTPTIGIFGPTSPWHWAPLNPLTAAVEMRADLACRPCHQPVCRLVHHRCMREIPAGQVLAETHRALAGRGAAL